MTTAHIPNRFLTPPLAAHHRLSHCLAEYFLRSSPLGGISMNDNSATRSTVILGQAYRNAPAAIEWLCNVLGFAKHAVYPGPDGTIMHAELTLGSGMVMLGSVRANPLVKQPDEIGGAETRSAYLIVANADEVYVRAKSAAAEILQEIKDESYGGRGFTCRDPEGHIWSVGTYEPWQAK